ncbi:MAG: dihydroorotate dehydrogenase [Clostridiaceae bacterium]
MLEVNVCGVKLKNPVIAASGTYGFGEEFKDFYNPSELGGISCKGLTINKKEGNEGVRIYETKSGLLNSVGLQNPGIEHFIAYELENMKKLSTAIIANMGGGTLEDYVKGAELLSSTDIQMLELNISCPNVKHGGMAFGIKEDIAYEVVRQVKAVCKKPLIVKLSPNAENIVAMAESCCIAGADGLSLVNTFNSMAVDITRRRPVFNNVTAGLSGPAIKPIALRMVYEVAKNVDVPVIGMGGIVSWQDAIEFIMAGATAVQVGTANFMNPFACIDIIQGIKNFMEKEKIKNLEEIRGCIL